MAKIVYLIRHGESQANAQGIYQGQSYDTPLTDTGKKQAQVLAQMIPDLKPKAIFVSPLKRTWETAQIINRQLKLKLVVDDRLMEINHGSWEGKTVSQFNLKEQKLLGQWREHPAKAQMVKGESIGDVNRRWLQFACDLPHGKFLVVTHDAVVRVAVNAVMNLSLGQLWRYHLDNCSLTTVSLNPPKLLGLNYNLHLNGLKSDLHRQAL